MKCADLEFLFSPFGSVLSPGEIAAVIRTSESTINKLIEREELPCFRAGRSYRVLKRDIIQCLEHMMPPYSGLPADEEPGGQDTVSPETE